MSGWVAISRGVFEHEFFARQIMSDREAWLWMIARAAWADTSHKVGPEMVSVPRGAFFCTLRELQSEWMWGSDTRVRNYLKRLETALMIRCEIVAKGNAQKTQISLCNYKQFQAVERAGNAEKNARETHAERTKETIEQDNKIKEKKVVGASASNDLFPEPEIPTPKARLPKEWALPEPGWAYARSKQLNDDEIKEMAYEFQSYWTDRTDASGRKSENGWNACWQGHVRRNAPQYIRCRGMAGKAASGGYGQSGSIASIVARRRAGGQV